jgi:hypothetical protein
MKGDGIIISRGIQDPGSGEFWTQGSGTGKNKDPDHISESLETIFWVKNT